MRIKHYAKGKFYTIQCPESTRVVRCTDQPTGGQPTETDHLIVPLNGKEVRIPSDPPELLPLLAETGNFWICLVGEPEPEERLARASCLGCGEADVAWLQLGDSSETVHCDRCGADFGLPARSITPVRVGSRSAE